MATKPPPSATDQRVKDPAAAREIYEAFVKDNRKRIEVWAQVSNQLEGGRPFDPAKMLRDGTAWQCNVNFGDAASAFERTLLPYWKMVNEVPNKIACRVHTRSPDSDKWATGFQEAFDLFLEDWGADYFCQFMLCTSDFVKFGPGYAMWPSSVTPRFKAVRVEKILFPKRAKANPDDWNVVAIEDEMTVSDIWEKMRTPKASERAQYAGWNRAALEKALSLAKNGGHSVNPGDDFTKLQDEIVSNDIAVSCKWAPIEIVRLFVREFSGDICCYIFTKNGEVDEFLYKSKTFAKSFRNIIGPIFYSLGRGGLIHTIKGFAVKNYYFSMLTNRMKSRLMDGATFMMGINFQKTTDTPDEQPPVENYGAVNVFPPGLTQLTIYPQLAQGQGIIELLERNQAENNAIYREQRKQIGETETATQANILAVLNGEMGAATNTIYLSQVGENLFTEVFRRLRQKDSRDPDAVKFVKRCLERGVPRNVIHDAEVTVKTGASASTATAAVREMIFRELMPLATQPGFNGRWIRENYVANKLGAHAVHKALLPEGTNSEPQSRKMAILENTTLGLGIDVPVDPNEQHFEHIDEHLKPLEQIALGYKQAGQITPEQVVALSLGMPHVERHFEFLKQDETRKAAYKVVWPRFSMVASIANGIAAQLQKAPAQ